MRAGLFGGWEKGSGAFFLHEKKLLSAWPVPEPPDYLKWLNHAQANEEIEKIREAIKRGRPYDSEKWASKPFGSSGWKAPRGTAGDREKVPDPFFFRKRSC